MGGRLKSGPSEEKQAAFEIEQFSLNIRFFFTTMRV
jgi:hypothetical protein